jgi:YgiT-type zinc finger domain-containing protein
MSTSAKECPLCGETMRETEREVMDRVPGTSQQATTRLSEWVCPECDYFEEVTDEEG